MIDLGLSRSERKTYFKALRRSRPMRTKVRILDQNEDEIGSLTSYFTDGEVDVDARADITRSLNLVLADPKRKLEWDPAAIGDHGLFIDRFIAVERGDWVEEFDDYVDCPVFWGPLSKFDREGAFVSIEAMGKEFLYLDPHFQWQSRTFGKGALKTHVIHELLADKGEQRFDLPKFANKTLPHPRSVGKMEEPWKVARRIAKSMDRQLFFDGKGRVRLRRVPDEPVFSFREDEVGRVKKEGLLVGSPILTYDATEVRNVYLVLGATPKGKHKVQVRYLAVAPKRHPLSPEKLSRNDKPRRMIMRIENDSLKTNADCRDRAERGLRRHLRTSLGASFACEPVPLLEELDPILLKTEIGERVEIEMEQFVIPLTSNDLMDVGDIRHKAVRQHRHRHAGK